MHSSEQRLQIVLVGFDGATQHTQGISVFRALFAGRCKTQPQPRPDPLHVAGLHQRQKSERCRCLWRQRSDKPLEIICGDSWCGHFHCTRAHPQSTAASEAQSDALLTRRLRAQILHSLLYLLELRQDITLPRPCSPGTRHSDQQRSEQHTHTHTHTHTYTHTHTHTRPHTHTHTHTPHNTHTQHTHTHTHHTHDSTRRITVGQPKSACA